MLGSGSCGRVWKAERKIDHAHVAVILGWMWIQAEIVTLDVFFK